MRITWFMLHSGYIRFFGPVVRELATRGHDVQLAFTVMEKDAGDAHLAHDLAAELPSVTVAQAPLRARRDGWRPLAGLIRALIDLGRYAHPRYADSPALRARMARKLTEHVSTARAIDPLTRRSTLRLIRSVEARTDERLSRRLVDGLGALERGIPTAAEVDRFLQAPRPDAVLVSPLVEFASTQVEYVKSARKLGIPVGAAIASWDNLSGKGLIRVVPDRVFVWNETQVREADEMHGIPPGRTVATGAPKFDEWFARSPRPRDEFLARVGLSGPYVLYVCSSAFIARDEEVAFVRRWIAAVRARLPELGILVRPHPQNAAQWHGAQLGVPVWPPGGAQPDEGEARADFFDSLAHAEAVVGINTSALLEAAILGRPVLAPRTPEFAPTQEGTLWFRYLRPLVRVGDFPDEHLDQLAERRPPDRGFVEAFLRPRGLELPAAPVMADEIERLAELHPAPPPPARAMRVALTPAAALASVVGGAAEKLRPPAEGAEVDADQLA